MDVLVIGSGGREHALAWKLRQSPQVGRLFVAPGNAGTAKTATNVALDASDHNAVAAFCEAESIGLVVVGPEVPLVAGLADDLRERGILVFGPSRAAAQLEGSKAFTKALCDEMHIPTAAYGRFDNPDAALAYLRTHSAPIVIKADGLAAGKGVTVAMTDAEAEEAVRACFDGEFGAAGAEVVIEEFLSGEEASLFAVSDGRTYRLLATAQDHKRAFDGDAGPNTGGMGAYSPAPVMTPELTARAEREIIAPTIAGMAARGTPFLGVLYAGLMLTDAGPKLIEYNVRFGDPECQVLMPRLRSDLMDLLLGSARGDLGGVEPEWRDEAALTVVIASKGYPGSYEKGRPISGLHQDFGDGVTVFHAGTTRGDGQVIATGGRVLNVTAIGDTVADAQRKAYEAVDRIDWKGGFCRRDIGYRAINRENR
ncbi:MAG: phosphoribosylamine--glycine ligase [Hyphomicrobiaceae bacterium]|nr:phosphoribosylamine--glycine ligase [Hyphomicrobiaceae bacterium]